MSTGHHARGRMFALIRPAPAPRKVPRGRPLDALLFAVLVWALILLAIHAIAEASP